MKLSSVLRSAVLAAALLATASLPSVSARSHYPRSHHSVSVSSPSFEESESRLESLVHKLERLERTLEQRIERREEEQFREDEQTWDNEREDQVEETQREEDENEDDSADADSAEFAAVDDHTASTISTFNTLLATWPNFFKLYMTAKEAVADGWVQDTKACNAGSAVGLRYHVKASDPGVDSGIYLLFGANGEVAGVQSVISVNPGAALTSPSGGYVKETGVNGKPVWTITAYFRDPKNICNAAKPLTGRSADGLWFAYKGTLDSVDQVPNWIDPSLNFAPVKGSASFARAQCMDSMGVHWTRTNWNDKSGDIDPYFLLYHPKTNQLVSFGFLTLFGRATAPLPGKYWEHIPVLTAPLFMKPNQIPLDMVKGNFDGRNFHQNAIHFYFVEDPAKTINCHPYFINNTPPSKPATPQILAEQIEASVPAAKRTLPKSSGRKAVHAAKKAKKVVRKPVAKHSRKL